MSTLLERKLHNHQQLFHIHMVAIPFFYSTKPTNILITQKVPMSIFQKFDCQVMQKMYYKNNKPVLSQIVTFQSVQKAQKCKQAIIRQLQQQNKHKFLCEFCKDISHLSKILFEPNNHYIIFPQTKQLRNLIDSTAQSVVMNGFQVQQKLKSLELKQMSFLNEQILSLEHQYYRWRVYSYMQADGDSKYRVEKFRMTENGAEWYPPLSHAPYQYPSLLNPKQVKYFTESLEKMERRKYAIEELMIFAIHNLAHAVHIASIIMVRLYELLMEKQTGDFVSILYLISDILFNSTNHTYRDLFQSQLPIMVYRYVLMKQQNPDNDGQKRTNGDKLLTQMKKLFSIWQKKFIFDQNFMKGLSFLLELTDLNKLYKLAEYTEHKKIREILGGQQVLYQLQKSCFENGLPYFQGKEEESKLFLNALFCQNDEINDVQPDLGKYDGEQISEKDFQKIQSKGIRVVCCQNLPISMVYDKNWKSYTSKSSLSQDGA